MVENIQGVWRARPCLWDIGDGATLRNQKRCDDNSVGHICKHLQEGTEELR